MASNAPLSPLRKLLDERLSQLAADADALADTARERARQECAGQLNQAVRRIRQAASPEELSATVADVAAAFATGAALLLVTGDTAKIQKVRGAFQETGQRPTAESFENLEIPLASAPALASAIETRDPVVAVAAPGEVSEVLMDLPGRSSGDRVSIYPIVARDRVRALLYVWGMVEGASLELVAQAAGAGWLDPEPPAVEAAAPLVTIAPAPRSNWDSLSAPEQHMHLRAQRRARVQVAEMRLHHAEAVQAGRARRDLYGSLRTQIDAARENFRHEFFDNCPNMVDYLHLETLRTLANDDAELLGKDYPEPLV